MFRALVVGKEYWLRSMKVNDVLPAVDGPSEMMMKGKTKTQNCLFMRPQRFVYNNNKYRGDASVVPAAYWLAEGVNVLVCQTPK